VPPLEGKVGVSVDFELGATEIWDALDQGRIGAAAQRLVRASRGDRRRRRPRAFILRPGGANSISARGFVAMRKLSTKN